MSDARVCLLCGEFLTFHNGSICPKEWEIVRNQSWDKQERFVSSLIKQNCILRSIIDTIANDKYSRSCAFKNIDGNVGEFIERNLKEIGE